MAENNKRCISTAIFCDNGCEILEKREAVLKKYHYIFSQKVIKYSKHQSVAYGRDFSEAIAENGRVTPDAYVKMFVYLRFTP